MTKRTKKPYVPVPSDARSFNIAAITNDGRTISTQRWAVTLEEAVDCVRKWIAEERWYGHIAFAVIYDHQAKTSRYFNGEMVELPQ